MGNCYSENKGKTYLIQRALPKHSLEIRKEIAHLRRVRKLVLTYLKPILSKKNVKAVKDIIKFYSRRVLIFECPDSRVAFQEVHLCEQAYYQFIRDLEDVLRHPIFQKSKKDQSLAQIIVLVMKRELNVTFKRQNMELSFLINRKDDDAIQMAKSEA